MVHSVPERFGPCIYLVLYNVYIFYRSVCVWDNITIQEKTDKQYSIVIRILSYNMFVSIWYGVMSYNGDNYTYYMTIKPICGKLREYARIVIPSGTCDSLL